MSSVRFEILFNTRFRPFCAFRLELESNIAPGIFLCRYKPVEHNRTVVEIIWKERLSATSRRVLAILFAGEKRVLGDVFHAASLDKDTSKDAKLTLC
jgi:hypothetical protein